MECLLVGTVDCAAWSRLPHSNLVPAMDVGFELSESSACSDRVSVIVHPRHSHHHGHLDTGNVLDGGL